jgi:hypothetical protein
MNRIVADSFGDFGYDIAPAGMGRGVATRKMHQTTIRFSADLWAALERESAALGVSVAQFVRESALARLMYEAGRRGGAPVVAAVGRVEADAARGASRSAFEDSAASWVEGRERSAP